VNTWTRTVRYSAVVGVLVVALACCGTPSGGVQPTGAATTATTSAEETETPSDASSSPETPEVSETPTATASDSATDASSDDASSPSEDATTPDDADTPKPPVLDKAASGRDLTSADFFFVPNGWRDGRFNVAGQKNLAGIAGPLEGCSEEADDDSPTLELRLANNFSNISMKVGESDDSKSSDAVVSVKLTGNGIYIDTVTVPFNKINTFRAPVANVNALKVQVWMGGKDCMSNMTVDAVLMELRVE
jgi:hypothetical protein